MLMQFDPFREADRLAEQLAAGARTPRPFPMDAYRRGDEFVVSFDLPGITPGKIDLTVEQNVLTIKAERRFDGREGDEVIAAERLHGAFTRQLFLGDTLDAERLVANRRNPARCGSPKASTGARSRPRPPRPPPSASSTRLDGTRLEWASEDVWSSPRAASLQPRPSSGVSTPHLPDLHLSLRLDSRRQQIAQREVEMIVDVL